MINPPSLQRPYDEFWSFDPAIVPPPDDPPSDADDDVKGSFRAAVEEWKRRLDVARETGNWSAVTVPGMDPTRFTLEPITGQALREIRSRLEAGQLDMTHTAAPLAFRACIVKISNPSIEFKHERDKDLGRLAPVSLTNKLDAIDPTIVTELGILCLTRGTQGPSPKS